MTRSRRWTTALIVVLVAVQLGLVVLVANRWHPYRPLIQVQIPAFLLSLVVIALIRWARIPRSWLARGLLVGCALMQLGAVLGPPTSSDDDYRYIWDATVQLAGVDPYSHPPSDPSLHRLRTEFLFPGEEPCRHNALPDGGCTLINRPTVRTIYPPVAQAAFAAIHVISFGGRGHHLPLQLLAGLAVVLTCRLLIRLADSRGSPLWPVAAWALSPLVAIEATSNAHIDWLAALLAVCALLALRAGRPVTAGLALGAAIATKLYPGILLATGGRRPVKLVVSAAALVSLSYLPHVIAVGPKVLGYLPTYLTTESYSDGKRYFLVSWLTGGRHATPVALLVLAAGWIWLWWRADPRRPEDTAVTAAGLLILVSTPHYGWYALILIAMIAASGRIEWIWTAFAPGLQYMSAELHWNPDVVKYYSYGLAVVVLLAGLSARGWRRRRARLEMV